MPIWAEEVGTPLGVTATLILGFTTLLGGTIWLLKYLLTTTLPAQAAAFTDTINRVIEHCEKESQRERDASAARYEQAMERLKEIYDKTVALLERVGDGVREAVHVGRNVHQSLVYRTQLSAVVTEAEVPIWTKTIDGVVLSWNRAAEEAFGWPSEDVVGKSVYRVIPPERHQQERELMDRLRRGEHVGDVETERLHRDGRRVRVLVSVSAVKEPGGAVSSVSSIARVVS
jgi:PAS domain S-box-containing protein